MNKHSISEFLNLSFVFLFWSLVVSTHTCLCINLPPIHVFRLFATLFCSIQQQ